MLKQMAQGRAPRGLAQKILINPEAGIAEVDRWPSSVHANP